MTSFFQRGVTSLMVASAAIMVAQPSLALVVVNTLVSVEVGEPSAPTTTLDPAIAMNTIGNSFALADLATGTFKVKTFAPGTLNTLEFARASGSISILNDDAVSVPFLFSVNVDAMFAVSIDPNQSGRFGNTFQAGLGVGPQDFAGVVYGHDATSFSVDPVQVSPAATIIHTATRTALNATLVDIAFALPPGAQASFSFSLSSLSFAEPGASALIDASNTYQVFLQLPVGVSLSSPIPLTWVTSVPEPSIYCMILLGLAGLALQRLRRIERSAQAA